MTLHNLLATPTSAVYDDETNEVTLTYFRMESEEPMALVTHEVSVTIKVKKVKDVEQPEPEPEPEDVYPDQTLPEPEDPKDKPDKPKKD